jgi:hypothetical protein
MCLTRPSGLTRAGAVRTLAPPLLYLVYLSKVPHIDCDNMREFAPSPTPAEGEQKSVTEWVSEASLMGRPPTVFRILTVFGAVRPHRLATV